jgi:thiol-disulfide isomerase/thioredoxin
MRQFLNLIFLAGIMLLGGCNPNNQVRIFIDNQSELKDSLVIRDFITQEHIVILPYNVPVTLIKIDYPTLFSIARLSDPDNSLYWGILSPNRDKTIKIDSGEKLGTNCLADSLLHQLFVSNNSFIGQHQNFIFRAEDPIEVFNLFDSLIIQRDSLINRFEKNLTSAEREILLFQNSGRAYSFLFFYGRLIKNLDPDNPYWEFIKHIDNHSNYNRSLPHNLLYKFEIEYLRKHHELKSIPSFIDFIHLQTNNRDLANYLTAIYIKELIASPSYWKRHNKLFDAVSLQQILEEQKNNPYREVYERVVENFFASQKGMEAFNFTAIDTKNQPVKLSDFSGQFVLIAVWATWCGPCIAQKPHFYKLSSNHNFRDNIQFITISVESSIDRWQNFLAENRNLQGEVLELIVPAGKRTEFLERYSATFLPKYILIDQEGKIIDADAPKPSQELESMLNGLLSMN